MKITLHCEYLILVISFYHPVVTISEVLKKRKEDFKLDLEYTSLNENHKKKNNKSAKNSRIIINCIGIIINSNLEGNRFSNDQEQD